MARVFVVGARIPTGGAFMAYHLGRILHLHFGYDFYDVEVIAPGPSIFTYDIPIIGVTLPVMEQSITPDDVLIANPSFSSHLFGLRLMGKKIMYIQDFKTFTILDVHCDGYACVSSVVQNFVTSTWGVRAPIIPPFIQLRKMPGVKPWRERPKDSLLVYLKHNNYEHQALFDMLRAAMLTLRPGFDLQTRMLQGRKLTHEQFMGELGSVRHALILSIAEGFGLVPLEAMALGTTVLGLDGAAGRDYMRYGENCLSLPFSRAHELAQTIDDALNDEDLSERVAKAGVETAQHYGYQPFRDAWLKRLSKILGQEPHGT